jgi:NADH-quinone oxidoreductase subunit C
MKTANQLLADLQLALGEAITKSEIDRDELTITAKASRLLEVATALRDHAAAKFTILIDLHGMDYSSYADTAWEGPRFAVIYNLLSVEHNCRVRLKVFCADDDFPMLDSTIGVWAVANWFEREAFDLYGIIFQGHNDLRRILTDYGFIGHPFRKDFPVSGYVEMRYDADQRRVVYQPVTIEPRENVPRVVREDNYGASGLGSKSVPVAAKGK